MGNFFGVNKSKVANRLKRILPKFRADRSYVQGVNGCSKFDPENLFRRRKIESCKSSETRVAEVSRRSERSSRGKRTFEVCRRCRQFFCGVTSLLNLMDSNKRHTAICRFAVEASWGRLVCFFRTPKANKKVILINAFLGASRVHLGCVLGTSWAD